MDEIERVLQGYRGEFRYHDISSVEAFDLNQQQEQQVDIAAIGLLEDGRTFFVAGGCDEAGWEALSPRIWCFVECGTREYVLKHISNGYRKLLKV